MIQLLLDNSSFGDVCDKNGFTPAAEAFENGRLLTMEFLQRAVVKAKH